MNFEFFCFFTSSCKNFCVLTVFVSGFLVVD